MGRKQNEGEGNSCRFFMLLLLTLACCSLVYMGLSVAFRPQIWNFAADYSSMGESATIRDGDLECCNGIKNLELWGPAVKWGSDFKFNFSDLCCQACKSMCSGDGPCLCNSWVYCGDKENCGDKFGECWLKKQKDVLNPDMQVAEGHNVWTSGLVFGNGEGIVALETEYGTLHIKLFPDCAPHSVAYIIEVLKLRHCAGCHIYRAEGRGDSWDSEGNHIKEAPSGPPFALLQGVLEPQGITFKKIPVEICPDIRRGSVAWIGSGPEFFISLANHDEWKRAYTVFGSVLPEDMAIAEKIARLPTKPDTWSNIKVSVLENPIIFKLRRLSETGSSSNSDAS